VTTNCLRCGRDCDETYSYCIACNSGSPITPRQYQQDIDNAESHYNELEAERENNRRLLLKSKRKRRIM